MKQDIKQLYNNQISQSNVLNDVISIDNILRGLINENILKINQIISTISFLNDMMDSIMNSLDLCGIVTISLANWPYPLLTLYTWGRSSCG